MTIRGSLHVSAASVVSAATALPIPGQLATRRVDSQPFANWRHFSTATPHETSSSGRRVGRFRMTVTTKNYPGFRRSWGPDLMIFALIKPASIAAVPVRFVPRSAPFRCCLTCVR